jgi:hypothetical protein
MLFKLPKDTKEIHWTRHIKEKMKEYQLSERRLLKIFRNPERKEEGIAPDTVAVMQTGGRKRPYEIWLMYQIRKSTPHQSKTQCGVALNRASHWFRAKIKNQNAKREKIIMISAWKYPGKSPIKKPPIPEEVLENLEEISKE